MCNSLSFENTVDESVLVSMVDPLLCTETDIIAKRQGLEEFFSI